MKDIEKYSDQAIEMIMTYGPKLILAIVVLIIGLLIIKPVVKGLKSTMNKRNVIEVPLLIFRSGD
jgi:small conductance mechanosensitive channel